MYVVSYAQIAFKHLIFYKLVQPMCTRSNKVLILHMCIGWSSQVSMGNLPLSFRKWDYSSILHAAVSPIHKYRNRLCISIVFVLNKTLTKKY